MQDYELMIIIKPDLEQEAIKGIFKEIREAVKAEKGVLATSDVWGIRELAYKIGKYEQGTYCVFPLKLNVNKVKKISAKLLLMESILRFMVTKIQP